MLGTTRSAAALDLWLDRLDGALVAIGNAPTALFRLLELIDAGAPKPAAVIGMPVGFVGAAEFKQALASQGSLPFLIVKGRKGGSAMAAAAVNAHRQRGRVMTAQGTLYGVGVGPGDPELMSLKAARILKSAPVIAFFAKKGNPGNARRIVDGHLNPDAELIRLDYPFTTELAETDPRLPLGPRRILRCEREAPRREAGPRPGRGRALRRRSLLLRLLCASA